MNYLICFLPRFVIVRESLARLAVRGERFWVSARQRPRRPDSSELPSPLLYLPGSVVSRHGRILVRAMVSRWEPPALAGGAGLQSSEKTGAMQVGFSPGILRSAYASASRRGPALKRIIEVGAFFRNAEALLPRMNAGAPTEKQVR
jgi:hypothetical protein